MKLPRAYTRLETDNELWERFVQMVLATSPDNKWPSWLPTLASYEVERLTWSSSAMDDKVWYLGRVQRRIVEIFP